jgi:hypothetical protein
MTKLKYNTNEFFEQGGTFLFETNLGNFESKVEKYKGNYYTTNPKRDKYKCTSIKSMKL